MHKVKYTKFSFVLPDFAAKRVFRISEKTFLVSVFFIKMFPFFLSIFNYYLILTIVENCSFINNGLTKIILNFSPNFIKIT